MLKIKNLKASINNKQILKGLNLNIKPGELHAIMGPNGSGKSTLANILSGKKGYEISGELNFQGESLKEVAVEERAQKGVFLSFQYPVEIPGISVANFIKTAINQNRKAKGLPNIKAKDLLLMLEEKMNLLRIKKNYLSRSMNEGFSGGEKKRNEIFQLAMLEPELAILDETDSGLDIDAMRAVADGINASVDGAACLIITHYQRILEHVHPDHVHVLIDGRIVASDGYELAEQLEDKGYEWLDQGAST